MNDISASVRSAGAGLLKADVRTPDSPRTEGAAEVIGTYFRQGWHTRDERVRCVPLLLRGEPVAIDQDIFTAAEISRSPFYQELLAPQGFQWFAAIGFRSGPALWTIAIQRTKREGPFDQNDKRYLGQLAQSLTEAATLSRAVGQIALAGITDGLQLIGRPVLALDWQGFVVGTNQAAEQIFDADVSIENQRLIVRDAQASAKLDTLIDQMRNTPDTLPLATEPIAVFRRTKRPIVMQVLPVSGAARTPFLGARVLLLLSDLERTVEFPGKVLARTFKLTPSETELATLVATGMSVEQAAEQLGIARETARNQLKMIFSKTNTHRQGELVALLTKLL